MKKITTALVVLAFVIMATNDAHAQTSFTRNLSIGSRGEDVRELQQILNKDSRTQLGISGAGSSGNETSYFGPLTHAAVVRFQELYAAEILAPLGLSGGTGFFGLSTRAQIRSRDAFSGGVQILTGILTQDISISVAVKPRILSVSPESGGIGTTITITGEGFLPEGNDVTTLFEFFGNVRSTDGTTLKVTVVSPISPQELEENKDGYKSLEFAMPYQIIVRNRNGMSNMMPFSLLLYE